MNPAYSIIFFTTASGAGYGILALLGIYGQLGALPPGPGFVLGALGLGFVLVTAGLLSSTFHLGHPERAWRALSQWRTSWLSREGVAAVLTYVPVSLFAILWLVQTGHGPALAALGGLTALGAAATVVCTGMIYASLRAIPRWHHPTVPVLYLLLGGMSGALWLHWLVRVFGVDLPGIEGATLGLILAAGGVKLVYWRVVDRPVPGTSAATATGLDGRYGAQARVTLLEPPHTEPNYLQKEMGYVVARRHASRLREHAVLLGFALPVLLTVVSFGLSGWPAVLATAAAALSGTVGLVIERWLFFAEARHAVTLYYGAQEL